MRFELTFTTILFLVEIVVLLLEYRYAKKTRKPYSKEISHLSLAVAFYILGKMLITCVHGYYAFLIFNTLCEISLTAVYYFLVKFFISFIHMEIPDTVYHLIASVLASDSVILILSTFMGLSYTVKITYAGYPVISYTPLYYVHVMVLSACLLYGAYYILKKMMSVYSIYWPRYLAVLVVLGTGAGADLFRFYTVGTPYVLRGRNPLFVAVTVIFVLTMLVRSRIIRSYEYAKMLDSVSQYLFLFDTQGECVVVNNEALEFFELDAFDLSNAFDLIYTMTGGEETAYGDGFEKRYPYMKGDQKYYLRLNYRRMQEKDVFVGEIYGFTDVTKETEELKLQRKMARYDAFTQIYNRDWLYETIHNEIEANPEKDYYVLGSDIRDFKVFNDVFGKEAGDAVIQKTAEVLRKLHDEGKIIHFGRIYADRFGMLAPKEGFDKNSIVEEFFSIDHPFKEEYYHLNIHFGVYQTGLEPGLSVKNMFDRAYVALDVIKNDVNIRAYHYNLEMRDEKVWEQTISGNIERALKEGQIRIVVQPQVNGDEEIIGGEALIRWRHPDNGEISPGNFIPILEKTGLVTSADVFVWEESCKLLRHWQDLGYSQYYISVNISATDFIFADIYTIFTSLVGKYGINPKNLKLEVTETAMMTEVLERIVLIKRLRDFGFTVELDDFGSGYSSLNMLKEIPVDVIKLDMKFLYAYNNEPESNSRKIIGHMCSMAKDLDMEIVAEGVETQDQLNFLKEVGCDVFQGYYFSKPIEVVDFEHKQGIA